MKEALALESSNPSVRRGSDSLLPLMIAALVLGAAWTLASRVPPSTAPLSAAPPSPKEGFSAPDFTLESFDGSSLTLSDLRGKVVVVNLWASWCLPCRYEMPAFEAAYQRYRDAGLTVVGVNMTPQDSEPAARGFAGQLGLTFPIVLDRNGAVARQYRLLGLPSTFFVDRRGIIRTVIVGGPLSQAAIEAHIENLLQEQ